jgi:flavin reductase (DIM6/NTAB) family NADH-FMN oxidoreductase RutF
MSYNRWSASAGHLFLWNKRKKRVDQQQPASEICQMHVEARPSILYFGTPVVLISSLNPDGSPNLAPVSSVFWLGYRALIGISAVSKTTENILRESRLVLNLADTRMTAAVNRLALTTGSNPVPPGKQQKGYRFVPDKFARAGLTPLYRPGCPPPAVAECQVQLEADLMAVHPVGAENGKSGIRILVLESKVTRVWVDPRIQRPDKKDHIDPDRWRPLIMSFQQFYGLGKQLENSVLASIPEQLYRTPDHPE